IQKLPTTLVAAFRATLEEISEADLILHLVDVTHPNARQQIRAVEETLAELNIHDVPTLLAFNKIDALTPEMKAEVEVRLGDLLPQGSVLSALTGAGVG
ncbi:MAG: GTPase HflX, partial [Chloroflexus sp.]|nr:GTPase HflX [Chloroflexus sp.]